MAFRLSSYKIFYFEVWQTKKNIEMNLSQETLSLKYRRVYSQTAILWWAFFFFFFQEQFTCYNLDIVWSASALKLVPVPSLVYYPRDSFVKFVAFLCTNLTLNWCNYTIKHKRKENQLPTDGSTQRKLYNLAIWVKRSSDSRFSKNQKIFRKESGNYLEIHQIDILFAIDCTFGSVF